MNTYYRKVTSQTGKKFLIYYIKKFSYWQCNACNKVVRKGETFSTVESVEKIQISTNQEKIVTTEIKTSLINRKDKVACNRKLKDKEPCKGEIVFKGWKIWVEDVTNEKVTEFGGIAAFRHGSITVETCFVDMRDKIDYQVTLLTKKYEEN